MKAARIIGSIAACAVVACSDAVVSTGGGNLTEVYLTDNPFPYHMIARVDVHVVRLDASTSLDTIAGSVPWTTVATPDRTINLLELQAGSTTLLGSAVLPAGQYQAVRLVIRPDLSSVTGIDGSDWPVIWGGGTNAAGELAMYAFVEDPLDVSPQGARIVIDFDVGRSFQLIGSSLLFQPWLRAVNDAATGTVQGSITGSGTNPAIPDAVVSAYRGGPPPSAGYPHGWLFATGRTDLQGHYALAYLPAGVYWLEAEGPATIEGQRGPCVRIDSVTVTAGQTLTLDAALPLPGTPCDSTGGGGGGGQDTTGTDSTVTGPGGPVAHVAVAIYPNATPAIGDSAYAVATLTDAAGAVLTSRTVTWTVSDPSAVTMFAFGPYLNFWPTKSGSVTFTATSEGVSGSATATVP